MLARRRFEDLNIWSFAGPNALVRTWFDSNDLPRLEVIPVHLVGRPDATRDDGTGAR